MAQTPSSRVLGYPLVHVSLPFMSQLYMIIAMLSSFILSCKQDFLQDGFS